MITAALRSAIEKIPTREERLGGQAFKYVKLSEVLDLLDTFRSSNAHEPCEQLGASMRPAPEADCHCSACEMLRRMNAEPSEGTPRGAGSGKSGGGQ